MCLCGSKLISTWISSCLFSRGVRVRRTAERDTALEAQIAQRVAQGTASFAEQKAYYANQLTANPLGGELSYIKRVYDALPDISEEEYERQSTGRRSEGR